MNNETTNAIVLYQTENGKTQIDVTMRDETLWLTQKQLTELFDVKTPAISKHLKNIFESGELNENTVVSKMEITAQDGKKYKTQLYNLDAVIAIGYRINSQKATAFRIWATDVLKTYIIKGYALNELKLQKQASQISSLKSAIALFERSLEHQIESRKDAQEIAKLLATFAEGLDLLDDFDHERLDDTGKSEQAVIRISKEEFLNVIQNMQSDFESDVFAVPKDDSFESSINQIYQSFNAQDCYPSLEEKASMLLYLIVKNHSFVDGNKRIGASCFLYFLDKNNILYQQGIPIIDNNTLFALTLLIASSKPEEMETTKKIVMSVLNRATPSARSV